jgi:hypothetical protein
MNALMVSMPTLTSPWAKLISPSIQSAMLNVMLLTMSSPKS